MKKSMTLKIAATIAVLSTMTNVYSFDQLDSLYSEAQDRLSLLSDKKTLENVKTIDADKKEYLGNITGYLANLIRMEDAQTLYAERGIIPSDLNTTDAAYKIRRDIDFKNKVAIKFVSERMISIKENNKNKNKKVHHGINVTHNKFFVQGFA